MKNISEQIADWLADSGIDEVFTVTGGGAMFLNQALGAHEKLRCSFMHHEQACAMAAEGYARVSGKPAVVMLTTGPAPLNALNGVYGAYTDSIPMVVISGQVKRETCLSFHELPRLRQLGDQEGPTIATVAPVCKYSRLIKAPGDLVTALPEALTAAISGRQGPVWLDIPLDIQSSTEQVNIPKFSYEKPAPAGDLASQCREILKRLQTSNRPLILGGSGVRLSGATRKLLDVVERTGIPLATAWTHDLIPTEHPLFAGRPGTIGTRAGNFSLQNADFVLVLGSRLNIRQASYNWSSFAKNAWLVQVDIDPAELEKPTVKPDKAVVADINDFLEVFENLLALETLPSYSSWASWCSAIGKTYSIGGEHKQADDGPINPYVLVSRVFGQLRDDDVVVCGNASACILPFQVGTIKGEQRLFSNSGAASMGYDLPAAIGAAIATARTEKRRVVCFAGDGSLQMNIQELQTLKTSGVNVVVIVLNNGGYLSIWQTHENFFGRVVGATPASGVEFPDFSAVARAYGVRSDTISSVGDLIRLDNFLKEDGPMLLNVIVDPRQEFEPRIKSRVDENGKFVTPELDDMHPFLPREVVDSVRKSAESIKSVHIS